MAEHDELIAQVVDTLREPVEIDPALTRRVMAAIAADQAPDPVRERPSVLAWLWRPAAVRMSPLGALAAAAGIAALGLMGGRFLVPASTAPTAAAMPGVEQTIEFVLVAPEAGTVALVGDFNDWDLGATPLQRDNGGGVWSVTVPLAPGRYRYSFLVDGTTWLQDPNRAPAVEDEFGRPNSVVTIGGAS